MKVAPGILQGKCCSDDSGVILQWLYILTHVLLFYNNTEPQKIWFGFMSKWKKTKKKLFSFIQSLQLFNYNYASI